MMGGDECKGAIEEFAPAADCDESSFGEACNGNGEGEVESGFRRGRRVGGSNGGEGVDDGNERAGV